MEFACFLKEIIPVNVTIDDSKIIVKNDKDIFFLIIFEYILHYGVKNSNSFFILYMQPKFKTSTKLNALKFLNPKNFMWDLKSIQLSNPYAFEMAPLLSKSDSATAIQFIWPVLFYVIKQRQNIDSSNNIKFDVTMDKIINKIKNKRIDEELINNNHYNYLILINPVGGKGKGVKMFQKHVLPIFQLFNISYQLHYTKYPQYAYKYLRYKLSGNELYAFHGIIVVGGDGTLNEVVKGIIDRYNHEQNINISNPSLNLQTPPINFGIIPAGSTNGTAFALYGCDDPVTAAIHIVRRQLISFDVNSIHLYDPSHFTKKATPLFHMQATHTYNQPDNISSGDYQYSPNPSNNLVSTILINSTFHDYSLSFLAYGFFGDILSVFDKRRTNNDLAEEDEQQQLEESKDTQIQNDRSSYPTFNGTPESSSDFPKVSTGKNLDVRKRFKTLLNRFTVTKGPNKYNFAAANVITCSKMSYPCTLIFNSSHLDRAAKARVESPLTESKHYKKFLNSQLRHQICLRNCKQCLEHSEHNFSNPDDPHDIIRLKVVSGLFDTIILMPISGRCRRTVVGVSPLSHIANGVTDLITVSSPSNFIPPSSTQLNDDNNNSNNDNMSFTFSTIIPQRHRISKNSSTNKNHSMKKRFPLFSRLDFLRYLHRIVLHKNDPFALPFVNSYSVQSLIFIPGFLGGKDNSEALNCDRDELKNSLLAALGDDKGQTSCSSAAVLVEELPNKIAIDSAKPYLPYCGSTAANVFIYENNDNPDPPKDPNSQLLDIFLKILSHYYSGSSSSLDSTTTVEDLKSGQEIAQSLPTVKNSRQVPRQRPDKSRFRNSTWNCDGEILNSYPFFYRVHRKLINFYSVGPLHNSIYHQQL